MASSKAFVDFILEQISFNGILDHRKMFGEYAVYADGKVVALICDNKLYIKQTPEGRSFIGASLQEAPAYPGAKNSFLIEEGLEDRDWLSQLIAITAKALPEPKPKKKKA